MKCLLSFSLLLCISLMSAQTQAGFENISIDGEGYIKDAGVDGGFISGNVFLVNNYTDVGNYDFWDGWVISNTTDTETPGFFNESSAYTGTGAQGSQNYAVSYVLGRSIAVMQQDAHGEVVNGMFVTNSTYAALSMINGDQFAKKFGGESGDDPDFFKLTVLKWLDGSLGAEEIEFYLADYRFADNSEDYIIDEWTWLDLRPLGKADSLQFSLSSSDNGDFGMNTPAYFCMDDMETSDGVVNTFEPAIITSNFFPNPTQDYIDFNIAIHAEVTIYNSGGSPVLRDFVSGDRLDVQKLTKGLYHMEFVINGKRTVHKFVKS